MGKMKEEFMNSMSDAEYQDWLRAQEHPPTQPATQEDKESEHNAWWNSLTKEQKQQLYNDQEEAFKLTIEEMNYERE